MSELVIILRVSRDGSHDYVNPTEHPLGGTGKFCGAALRTRLGLYSQLVIEEECTSPFKADLIALAVAE